MSLRIWLLLFLKKFNHYNEYMLVLTDVCDTLIDLNSTYDYIRFLYNEKYGNRYLWCLLLNRFFWIFSYILCKLTKFDIHRKLTFFFFKDLKKSDLNNINQKFWKFYISKKTKILDKIINHKKVGDKVVLVSASVNPPIDMLWNYLWVNHFSSELEENKWMYTWKVKRDLLWNKESLFFSKELDITQYNNVSFYTDNLSDIGFISKIQELAKNSNFFIVIKSEKIKSKRLKILSSNSIMNYEFIS